MDIINALCESFTQSSIFTIPTFGNQTNPRGGEETSKSMFHLRDFVYFLRYISKHSHIGAGANFELTPQALLRGLQRNFNGITKENFRTLVFLFFDNIGDALEKHQFERWEVPDSAFTTTSIELIKDSLADKLGKKFIFYF